MLENSQFITTLYDQKYPVGHLGYGTHYSILRTSTWFDNCGLPLNEPKVHDFAVIWDKDHDKRIIDVVEHLYMMNLLTPVLFVGESNGSLSVVVSPLFKKTSDEHVFQAFFSSIFELANNQYEPWTANVSVFGESLSEFQLIDSSSEHAKLYLKNIYMLWNLGLKNFRVGLRRPDLNIRPEIEVM